MHPLYHYNVVPKLPAALEPLHELVFNLWWTWEPTARKLFRDLDPVLWDRTNHNPLRMLQLSRQARLVELAADDDFIAEMQRVHKRFRDYMAREDTYGKTRPGSPLKRPVAYFTAEVGFHESVPNYSGGLGILSGDHCKSASDLDLNFCALTLLYRHGYFKQQINREGWQESISLNQNFHHLPIVEALNPDGSPLLVSVDLLGTEVFAKIWKLAVGRITLYLLDTDIPENRPEDRAITAELYGGDIEMRIRQEIVLGIGGVRALHAMGVDPLVYHMNEGHSAFLSLERIRRYMANDKLDFYTAQQVVAASNVFTTHTPVPAGNDVFPRELMDRYFGRYAHEVGISLEELFGIGSAGANPAHEFSMTILALRTSRHANGVSKLHGGVSRHLWKDVWAGVPQQEVPITSITNGVHIKTWVATEFAEMFSKYLGEDWSRHLTDPEFWLRVINIPDEVLWGTHLRLKHRLVEFVRERVYRRRLRIGEAPEALRKINQLLNPEVLTIGFARRFATYKRGALLFSQPERLLRLLNHPERPVQFIFAGKAHPRDEGGKRLIQTVYQNTRRPEFEGKIVFLEDYDHYVGRRLYQGVDLWLNNPLRPLEASGTSGMKLGPNGGLNFSVLDGWWCEGYNGKNGWAIGADITDGPEEFQNAVDVESMFSIIENQIVPLYYAKPDGRLPLAWIQLMRESIRSVVPQFNTHRMLKEYAELLYEPAASARVELEAGGCRNARELSKWKSRIRKDWQVIHFQEVRVENPNLQQVNVGDAVNIVAKIHLGPVDPAHVRVQAYFGPSDNGNIDQPQVIDFVSHRKLDEHGNHLFEGVIPAAESGTYGFNVRVVPHHPHLTQEHELRLITWAQG